MFPISLDYLIYLTVGGFLIWALVQMGRPRAVFTVRLLRGELQASEGIVTPALLQELREIAAAHGVTNGVVRGYAQGQFIRLWFSAEFPPTARQRLRNWWASFGWPPPRVKNSQQRR
jgi:hypothetical protein